jgi:hypothetical protein
MVELELFGRILLTFLRFVVFGLTLGMTIISFQAYRQKQTDRLQYAFLGFAFISMGVAVSSVITQLGADADQSVLFFFELVETIPFIIGFAMLYLSLYK